MPIADLPSVYKFCGELFISDDGDGVRVSDFRVGQTGGLKAPLGASASACWMPSFADSACP
ncbi:hypothetical protein DIPPA_33108 [Diplonema papillatum]|nr:hypothetical protein DIPPA_33108 [Diplonema papillatum]